MDWFLYDIGLRHERVKYISFSLLLLFNVKKNYSERYQSRVDILGLNAHQKQGH